MDLAAGDFNGDGKIDIAVTGPISGTGFVGILYNSGNGTFWPRVDYEVSHPPFVSSINALLAVADFNCDGVSDIAVTGLTVVSVLTSQTTGGFSRQDVSIGQTLLGIDAGDFNGDGRPDLVILNKAGLLLKRNNPDGSFSTTWTTSYFSLQRVIADDFNGDGIADLGMIPVIGGTTSLNIQINLGSGTAWNSSSAALGSSRCNYLVAADFNGDGLRDAVAIDLLNKEAVFLTNQGNGIFGDRVTYAIGSSGSKGIVAADSNGDGRPELISTNSGQTSVSLLVNASASQPQSVISRHVFYNHSHFDLNNPAPGVADDMAIDLSKSALLPGQTATFANYSSYSRGINGVMVDITGVPRGLTAADFAFKVGNDSAPETWGDAPAPVSIVERLGDATGSWTRVEITWADGAIVGQWLQVTLKSNAVSGLAADDLFYFGNAPGEAGNSTGEAKVNAVDEVAARLGAAASAGITHALDFNRDGAVDGLDVQVVRENYTYYLNELKLIQAPGVAAAGVWIGTAAPLGPLSFLPVAPPRLSVLPQSMPSLARPPLKQSPPLPQVVTLKLVETESPTVPGTNSPGFVARTTGVIRATLVKLALMKRAR
jgi:hypothetical protein